MKNTPQDRIQVVKFNSVYDEPTFQIKKNKKWIDFGHDNQAPKYIANLLDMSGDHKGIVEGIINFAIGEGFVMPEDTNTKAMEFFQNNNGGGIINPNDLNYVMERFIEDLVVYGGGLLNIRWTRDRSSIGEINHVPVETMRIDTTLDGYYLSDNWQRPKGEYEPEWFPKFTTERGVDASQLLYVKMPSSKNTPYALPHYWSVREYIELDQELATFDLNRVRNNFNASTIIIFKDTPTQEEQDINYKRIKDFYTGSKNAGKAAIMYGDDVRFEKFEPSTSPDDFEYLQKKVDNKIKKGHRVSGRGDLFGLNNGDGLTFSSNDDLRNEFEVFSRLVVRPYQKLVTKVFNALATLNGVEHSWEIEPFKLFDEDGNVNEEIPTNEVVDNTPIDNLEDNG